MGYIDLHIHSTFSDGTLTPEEIIRKAEKLNLKAIAITDHDTIDGIENFLNIDTSIIKVPGIEISVQMKDFNFHMVGLFIDNKSEEFKDKIDYLKTARKDRNFKIIKKLNELGYKITIEELEEIAEGEIGRPHISSLLLKKKYFKNKQEIFDKLLKKGAPAYFDKFRYSAEEAINLIKKIGKGIAIIAHPGLLPFSKPEKKNLIKYLKEKGLDGIEVYYSEHTESETEFLRNLAFEFDLVISGGTDFHGDNKKDIELGKGRGNLKIPFSVYEKLYEYWRKN